jgi:vesicular inhibitory amino acid transporter
LKQVLGNATFFQAVMNVLNILTGVGLLSIPFALRQAGWAGLGILWLLGIVTNYTGLSPVSEASLPHDLRCEACCMRHK